jgi:hypothetical protein
MEIMPLVNRIPSVAPLLIEYGTGVLLSQAKVGKLSIG